MSEGGGSGDVGFVEKGGVRELVRRRDHCRVVRGGGAADDVHGCDDQCGIDEKPGAKTGGVVDISISIVFRAGEVALEHDYAGE